MSFIVKNSYSTGSKTKNDSVLTEKKIRRWPARLAKGCGLLLFLMIAAFGYQVHTVQAASSEKNELQAAFCGSQTSLPVAECEALVALYNQTNGAGWVNHTGWLATTTPCSWYGVACVSGHVTQISLNSNGLNGTLPIELGNLPNLRVLSLTGNQLRGSMPTELGNLVNLQTLSLRNNQLTGSIPSELGNLDNLTLMALSTNQLSGPIPPSLGGMAKLQTLILYGNQLSGSIPPELGNIITLRTVELYSNRFTGTIPPQLGNLINATSILFGHNQLTGFVPSELGNLVNLYHLSFVGNPLSGPVPLSYTNLTKLEVFRYYTTSMCEPTSAEFQAWKATVTTWVGTSTCYGKTSPENGQAFQSASVILSWEPMSPVTTYEYCYDTSDDDSCAAWVNNGLNTSAVINDLALDTTYYWHVRARNGTNLYIESDSGVWWSFTTGQPSLGVFSKTSPQNNATNQPLSLTLAWTSAGPNYTYEYCVTQGVSFDCTGNWFATVANSVDVTNLANSTTYSWQVRALDGNGGIIEANSQDANPIWQFSTRPAPPSSNNVIYNGIDEDQVLVDDLPGANLMTFSLTGAQPAGTLSLSPEGHFSYQPPLDFYGQVQFQFTVADGINDPVGPYTVTIHYVPVNDAPIAVGDSYAVEGGAALFVNAPGVLGNDSDVDGPALTAGLVSGPSHGILTLNSDGSFQYQPNLGYLGADFFIYQASDGLTGSNPVVVNLTVFSTNRIFADGFEGGTLGGWTANLNDGGDLSASASAAMVGSYGMQAVIDDNNAIYVTDDSPNAEKHYRARFYFDPNSLAMDRADRHQIFVGYSGTSTPVFAMIIRRSPTGVFSIQLGTYPDAGVAVTTAWTVIADDRQAIEVDWQASSGVGASNGSLSWWLNGVLQTTLNGIDNDTRQIDRVRLGTVNGVASTTRGIYYFDDFVSDRSSYIGLVQ